MATLNAGDVDHAVLIVGWDEPAGAWIIKNSLGPDWGDQGFIKLKYDTANVGFNAAWVQSTQSAAPLSAALQNALEATTRNFNARFNILNIK